MDKQHTQISKFLSFILRHQPEAIGLSLEPEGWAEIDTLISHAAQSGTTLTRALIEIVVKNNDKKRFAHFLQHGNNMVIKHTAIGRVLVGSPFIKQ